MDNSLHGEIASLRAENDRLKAELEFIAEADDRETLRLLNVFRMTTTEARIVSALMRTGVRTKDWLLAHCCERSEGLNNVSVHMTRIRRKLPPDTVETVFGRGYQIRNVDLLRRVINHGEAQAQEGQDGARGAPGQAASC